MEGNEVGEYLGRIQKVESREKTGRESAAGWGMKKSWMQGVANVQKYKRKKRSWYQGFYCLQLCTEKKKSTLIKVYTTNMNNGSVGMYISTLCTTETYAEYKRQQRVLNSSQKKENEE